MLKINFADTGNNGIIERFIDNTLNAMGYEYCISDKPQYLFCGDFLTYQFLEYDNCIKILICGENEYPDFNMYDYVLGNVKLEVCNRYLRYPFYLWRDGTKTAFLDACNKRGSRNLYNRKFCNMVVSNGVMSSDYREQLFWKLSEYKRVDSAGAYLNNVGFNLPKKGNEKLRFASEYKFSIACENASTPGYTTEKIVEAWNARTVPIYWGNPQIDLEFNSRAFVNCHEYENMDQIIERVRFLDNNIDAYLEVLNQPILSKESDARRFVTDDVLFDFFENIFAAQYKKAKIITSYSRVGALNQELKRCVKESYYWNCMRIIRTCPKKVKLSDLLGSKRQAIYIYGAGVMGQEIASLAAEEGLNIKAYVDKTAKMGMTLNGISVISLPEMGLDTDEPIVIVSVYDPRSLINKQIKELLDCNVIGLDEIVSLATQ